MQNTEIEGTGGRGKPTKQTKKIVNWTRESKGSVDP